MVVKFEPLFFVLFFLFRHPRAGGDPERMAYYFINIFRNEEWIPACAGMTDVMKELYDDRI